MAGSGLQLALAAFGQPQESRLGLLAVGAMFLDTRQHRDVPRGPQQHVPTSLQLAADHGDVTPAVDAHPAIRLLGGIDGQVFTGFNDRGHVGAVVTLPLLAFATTE